MNKKCKKCGSNFKQYNTTDKYCIPCAIQIARDKQEEKKRTWPDRKKKMKEKLKTRTQKINEVRSIFQKYIRLRDKDKPCISCGTPSATKWDAGHYLKAELYTGLIFNEDNCHKQCQRCNQYGGGMQVEYRIGLVDRIGEDAVNTLEASKDNLRVYRWEDTELSELKEKYKKLVKKFGG